MLTASQMPRRASIGLLGRRAPGAELDETIDEEATLLEGLFGEVAEERTDFLEDSIERGLILLGQDLGDAHVDLAVTGAGSQRVWVFTGRGDGTFATNPGRRSRRQVPRYG